MHARLSRWLPTVAALSSFAVCAVAQAPTPPQVTVSGVTYSQYLYQLKDTANHVNNFNVTRAYVNVLGKFSGGVTTRVTTDVFTSGTSLAVRLKYAYVAYTPNNSPLTAKFGLIHTPWLDWEESLWDYRMQGSMALDRNGFLTSADFGAGVDGKAKDDRVNAQVTLVNGEGYGGGPGDQRKDVEARISVRVLNTNDNSKVGGLRVTGYAGLGKPTSGGTRNRFIGMASYRSKEATIAAEYASMKDTVTAPAQLEHTGRMISLFGVYHVPKSKASVLARVDLFDPNTSVSGDHQTRIIAGVSYQLSPNLRLLADVDNLSYEGGSPTAAAEAVRSQALFQTQFTF